MGMMIRTKTGGFTLIEILIAVLILAIVLSTVYAAYTGTFRIIRASEYDSDIYGMGRMTLERMMKDLGAISPYKGKFELSARRNDQGREGFMTLSFTSTANLLFNEKDSPPGVSTIEYFIADDREKEGYVLLRSDDRRREKGRENTQRRGFVLCDRLHSLRYTFFDATGKSYQSWDSTADTETPQKNRAPAIIAIELNLVNPGDQEHPYKFMTRVYLPVNKVESE